MSRRITRPNNNISKKASSALSDVRRAEINDTHSRIQDEDLRVAVASVAHSNKFKTNLNKSASIVSPMSTPTQTSHTERMSPEIYSPLFQLSNLNLPRDRITMNAWNRIYYDTHPLVRNAINLHASFPISKINISCEIVFLS